jgi:hypothetical protein
MTSRLSNTPAISRPPRRTTRPGLWKPHSYYSEPNDPDLLLDQYRHLQSEITSIITDNIILAEALTSIQSYHDLSELSEIDFSLLSCAERSKGLQKQRVFNTSKRLSELEAQFEELETQFSYLKTFFSPVSLETITMEVQHERQQILLLLRELSILREVRVIAEKKLSSKSDKNELFQKYRQTIKQLKKCLKGLEVLNIESGKQLLNGARKTEKKKANTEIVRLEQLLFKIKYKRELKENELAILKEAFEKEKEKVRDLNKTAIVERKLRRSEKVVRYPRPRHFRRIWEPKKEESVVVVGNDDLFEITCAQTEQQIKDREGETECSIPNSLLSDDFEKLESGKEEEIERKPSDIELDFDESENPSDV